MLECRTATDHGASMITTSDNGNIVCGVPWIRMADTLNMFHSLYCKIIVVTDVALKYCSKAYSSTFFANYQPGSDVLIHVEPSSCILGFYQDKIGIMPLVALCSSYIYISKIIKFYGRVQFLQAKM